MRLGTFWGPRDTRKDAKRWWVFGWMLLFASESWATDEQRSFEATLKPFVQTYCAGCHGAEKQKGKRRFDQLAEAITNDDTLIDYQDILDLLNLDEMPPEKADQPKVDEQREVAQWLTETIAAYHETRKGDAPEAVLRRLNAREYRHSIRDVLKLNLTMYDPARFFPRDNTSEHLDNVGAKLVTSGFLLARYLEAADRAVTKAMLPLHQPEMQTWRFEDGFHQQPEIDQVHRHLNRFKHMTLYEVTGADKHEGAYGPIHAFAQGVPHDGFYEITVDAEALNRNHPYDRALIGTDPNETFRLGIVAGDVTAGELQHTQPIEPLLAETALADGRGTYTLRVWLDAGWTPRFTFPNGGMDLRNLYSKLLKKYPDLFPKRKGRGIVENRMLVLKHGKLPQIQLHEIEIKGPIYAQWPTASQRTLLGDDWQRAVDGELGLQDMRRHVLAFATRAYRHPASTESVDRVMQLIEKRMAEGRTPIEAYGDGIKLVLSSPQFLYFDTGKAEVDFTLASRLSYFLWSAPPDAELLVAAHKQQLHEPEVLKKQVARMLNDPRSNAFVDGFLDSWLTLRDLGSAPPDRSTFRAYYHYALGDAMREETRLFTRDLLDRNQPIDRFLDSDYAFVNKPLARLYGITPPDQPGFQRVKLTDRRRGGLFGQASVLTVTANGIDTSPVVRGVWLLENILGTPPPPPPPDVEPLDPDIRGTTTIRDQLRKHRETPSCYDCHQAIDPLGFALENFDPIGGWRTVYDKRNTIDASGELPTGEAFSDVTGLKDILLARKDRFARALTNKLFSYALGRHVAPMDRPHIDGILTELEASGSGFQDLITLVVLSEPFRQ
ncbi:MAG: mono/diheme cytochrome c family protein [Candidatus Omnitrophota bacterium]|jgi:mono/diheme cytochrome c family protein